MFVLIMVTVLALLVSLAADREKTAEGVRRGLRMFRRLLPSLLNVLILVSVVLYLVPDETLAAWLGQEAGFRGMAVAAVLGSVALIPGFVAFPLSAVLLKSGVGYDVIAVFITTLMMVGVLTLPLEAKYFGMRVALMRNTLSFIGAVVIGVLVGLFL